MWGKILGKKSEDDHHENIDPQLIEKISKMNLSDMRFYVRNRLNGFEVCVEGLNQILKRLIEPLNDKGETYLQIDDMDSKKKKAFEVVLLILSSRKISLESVDLFEQFIEFYRELIDDYDGRNKEIYHSRFKKAIETALINIQTISHVNKKLDVLR